MASPLSVIERLATVVMALSLALASLIIFAQVICRYVLETPISWAEELAVLLFAWVILAGSAHVQASDSHLAIDSLRRLAGAALGNALDRVRLVVIVAVSAVMVWYGIALVMRTLPLLYPATGVPRALLYGAVPLWFAAILLLAVGRLLRRRPEPAIREADPLA